MINLIIIFKILLVLTVIGRSDQQQKSQKEQTVCYNPNRTAGKCVSIYKCKILYKALEKEPLTNDDIKFFQASQCINGIGPVPHVCCTNETSYMSTKTDTTTDTTTVSNTLKPIPDDEKLNELNKNQDSSKLPTSSQCGPSLLDQRIFNGKDADIGEFPWMGLLESKNTRKNEDVSHSCSGSLINSKYILTAAHCIQGKNLKNDDQLISVRLGEHDLRTVIDCGDPYLKIDCADKPVIIEIEELIPHEGYNETSPHRHHDIGLIRLKQHVNYTNYIKPVCLPSAFKLFIRTAPNEKLIVSGWGRTTTASRANIKQKLPVPVVNQADCADKFATQSIKIIDDQLCAGGEYYKDSCTGDSGGPLMKMIGLNWAIEGIVSFGYKCGVENWPAIYTRVSGYEDWIRSKLKA